MSIKQVHSAAEFDAEVSKSCLTVVDFFAKWCGPCNAFAPTFEGFAAKYPDVNFIKVDCDELKDDVAASQAIKSLPTFKTFVSGRVLETLEGANEQGVEEMIVRGKDKVNPFKGQGVTLSGAAGSGTAPMTKEQLAAARAARFANTGSSSSSSVKVETSSAQAALSKAILNYGDGDMDDEALARAVANSMECSPPPAPEDHAAAAKTASAPPLSSSSSSSSSSKATGEETNQQQAADEAEAQKEIDAMSAWDEEMVPLPVDEGLLTQLQDMGFADARSRKAIHHGNTLEGALEWLTQHENDPEIDQPYMVRKADTIPKKELTAEEKAEKLAKMTALVKQRRQERERAEKAEEIRREKERRERGQKLDETQEKRESMMRKRENEKIKKEKEDQRKERERLRAEIERDKEIRRLNKGVMPSVLGVDGYNPSAIQYDVKGPEAKGGGGGSAPAASSAAAAAAAQPKTSAPVATEAKAEAKKPPSAASKAGPSEPITDPVAVIDTAIQKLMQYRAGGDGGSALKLLLAFVKNVVDNPSEPKYRSINAESSVYKNKLGILVGPSALLRALGFEKNDEGKLVLKEGEDAALLRQTSEKLARALETFVQMNPV
jgi:thiol-disulfide isomerase/thioredoxin